MVVARLSVFFGWLFVLILDQSTKAWARSTLAIGESNPFLPGFIKLTLTYNTGAAFSFLRENNLLMILLAGAMTLGIILWLIVRERKGEISSNWERLGVGMLLGGATGNLIDRLTLSHVTDFLEFDFINFPVFNVADMMIDAGIVLILIESIRQSKKKHD